MAKLFSTRYTPGAFNTALLVLRLGFGILLAHHGYDKLTHYSQYESQFINFLGLGTSVSLSLSIFAELFCSILIILGLFTRLACIPIFILFGVIIFKVSGGNIFGKAEMGTLYLIGFLAIFIAGPGKVSIDSRISRQ